MQKVSIRMPPSVIDAYDSAKGTRSALMRRRLAEAVENGELREVDSDLRVLAEREAAVDRGRLARKRGKFKQRCYTFYRDCWDDGAVTPSDAADLSESWRREADLYGPEHMAFVEAVVTHFKEHWTPTNRDPWPDAGVFIARSNPDEIDVDNRLVEVLREADAKGIDPGEAVRSVKKFHPDTAVERAATEVFRNE